MMKPLALFHITSLSTTKLESKIREEAKWQEIENDLSMNIVFQQFIQCYDCYQPSLIMQHAPR